jgi:hypothetical protein
MYLIDLYNYKPPEELIVDREEARVIREQAARDNTVGLSLSARAVPSLS